MMRERLLLAFLLCSVLLQARKHTSLDNIDPVYWKGNKIEYRGEKIKLGERAFYVDATLTETEAARSPYVFRTLADAVAHLHPGTEDQRMTVYVAPSVYWIDDPDDPEVRRATNGGVPIGLRVDCPWLHLVGLASRPDHVVLACNRGQTQGAEGNFTMLAFRGDGLLLENLTLGNYCNVDLDYELQPSQSRHKRMDAITQAQLAFSDGDFLEARHCRFISRLNTCPLNGGRRTLFDNCYFECTDDALEGRAVYRHCRFTLFSSKPYYASSRAGSIMTDCDFFVKTASDQYLTKVASPLMLLDCRFHTPPTTLLGWCRYIPKSLRCYQYNVTQNGEPVTLSADSDGTTVSLDSTILLSQLSFLGSAPMRELFSRLEKIPIHAELKANTKRVEPGEMASLTAQTFAFGDLLLSTTEQPSFTGNNDTDTLLTAIARYNNNWGLSAACEIANAPKTMPAPVFTSQPRIINAGRGVLKVVYQLSSSHAANHDDESEVTWYRCRQTKGARPIAVSVSRGGHPETIYNLQAGDEGCIIIAKVAPRLRNTLLGEPVSCSTVTAITRRQMPKLTRTYETDFHNFPTEPQPEVISGAWTVSGFKPKDTSAQKWQPVADSWFYGEGTDGARGLGLLQKAKGARLLYTPADNESASRCMSITLRVDPCKTAGQGFGSATDQYMDLYIHFDTKTLTGYGLRIERTTKYANAVDMLLMRYENGIATPLTDPVSTTCYLTDCTLRLWGTADGHLHATASTTTPQRESPLAKEVVLDAPIKGTPFSGMGIQHTGSVGASATMLHWLRVEW